MKNKLFLILFLFCVQISVFSQQNGMPFITNYPPELYKGTSQNWAIVQDKRGVMFFGNSNGIFEYDGVTWRFIPMVTTVRSLAIDSEGRILVGASGDFGYLQPDSLGTYKFRSLKEKVSPPHNKFNDVWNIYVSGNQIFFQTFEKIFIYKSGQLKVVYPEKSFHLSFMVNQTLYVNEVGKGLMIYKNDRLQLIEGGERFAEEKIYAMLPFRNNEILIATRTQGVLIYSPFSATHFYKPASFEALDNFLILNMAYCGHVLSNDCFALGTLAGGIVVFNHEGMIHTIYDANSGLLDNSIRKLYTDNNQQLWAALNNGISLIQTNLPFRLFTEKNGLKGFPMCISFFKNRLYVGTSQHLCVQNPDGNFETIAGTEGQNWQLYPTNETLLLADLNGLFEIKGAQAIPLIKNIGIVNLCKLNNKQDFLLASLDAGNGLCLLEYRNKTWKIKNAIKGFSNNSYKTVQDKNGNIWVHANPELYKVKLNQNMDSAISVMQYTTEHGLPPDYAVPCLLNSGEIVFATMKGIYSYNSTTNNFGKQPLFNMFKGTIYPFQQQENGDVWYQEVLKNGIYEKGVLKYKKGKYSIYKQAFYKFNEYLNSHEFNFYSASDSRMYIGTSKGLLQYNPLQKVDYNIPFHTLIRKVLAKDSLVFGGASANSNEFEHINGAELSYSQNNLVFHYAAAFYEDVEKNLFSYRLLGSADTTWSAWITDLKKEYTNLPQGKYTFEVRSINQYKVIGKTAKYSFRILPPWYLSWWAFTIYLILLTSFVFSIVTFKTRRLKKEKENLEEIIRQRTLEINQQKEEIIRQRDLLITANATKDKFFGIIAHDLRNPFTALIGFSSLLIKHISNKEYDKTYKFAQTINQASSAGFELLENLLKWSRAQTGRIILKPENLEVNGLINSNLELLRPWAESKGVLLTSNVKRSLFVFADKDIVLTVMRNLISNAIKFTNQNDSITVEAEESDEVIIIRISDTGVGIDEKTIGKLFKVGESIKTKGTADEVGTGLGLIVCKEFVDLHNGKIWVVSKKGKGSKFSFTLPKSKSLC